MAYTSSTFMTTTDPSKVADDVNNVVRPALMEMGAQEVMAAEAMTGPVGAYVLNTRWESLESWAAAQAGMAANTAPGGPMAELMERYEPLQRALFQDEATAGTAEGAYGVATRFSVTAAPQQLDHAAGLAVAGGANGIRILTVVAGAEMTGQVVGAVFLDSPDAMAGVMDAVQGDATYQETLAAAGAQLQARTLYRMI